MAFDLDGEELKYNKEHPTGVYFPEEIKIVNPRVTIYNFSGLQIMKNIEKACRTCYRSEGKITEDSYKNLLTNCINRGHESVLEHEKVTVKLLCDIRSLQRYYTS